MDCTFYISIFQKFCYKFDNFQCLYRNFSTLSTYYLNNLLSIIGNQENLISECYLWYMFYNYLGISYIFQMKESNPFGIFKYIFLNQSHIKMVHCKSNHISKEMIQMDIIDLRLNLSY